MVISLNKQPFVAIDIFNLSLHVLCITAH